MKLDKMNYVDIAEDVIHNKLNKDRRNPEQNLLSTNQIRNVLDLTNELYDMVRTVPDKDLSEDVKSHIQYIRMKLVYAAAKDANVKDLLEKSELVEILKSVGSSRDDLILFCKYTEALVAYHKFYPHKDEK